MQTILFLCPHGGAKSVMAASYFNARGLPYHAEAAAAEDPYDAVPAPVAALLASEGCDVHAFTPRAVEPAEIAQAARVVAIGCDIAGAERWDDVPMASEDLEGCAAAIRRHVDTLVHSLVGALAGEPRG
jgi:protein-tyrosine-phosphatase